MFDVSHASSDIPRYIADDFDLITVFVSSSSLGRVSPYERLHMIALSIMLHWTLWLITVKLLQPPVMRPLNV
ncbi:CLUMA_CG002858, isoform A [Clunio marinus]|uniref:CLUMA_CG002858, isoform A n=1 Tax=Clunio marinus TaxID=568069 RepID=A0A1J1HS40_9DIPT|nr:CLUMA_CG002858, isoform A [Clunio marinus]